MARSTHIYMVLRKGAPISAFTVKREMEESLLETWPISLPSNVQIWRFRDGRSIEFIGSEAKDITSEYE